MQVCADPGGPAI